MNRSTWRTNVKRLLKEHGLSVAEAARLIGASKQYLSVILAETEPTSERERITERLSLLLHATPARLYTPSDDRMDSAEDSQVPDHVSEERLTPSERAVLAERHFQGGNYRECYAVISPLLTQGGIELVPRALALAELLAGKSACLMGDYMVGRAHLRRSLTFWQKRLSAQPEAYLAPCLDTYRYLAWASLLANDEKNALGYLSKGLALYDRFPLIAHDYESKWEALALSLLRVASRMSLGQLSAVADKVRRLADMSSLPYLAQRAHYELDCARYAVACALGRDCRLPEVGTADLDLMAIVSYGLGLLEQDAKQDLVSFTEEIHAAMVTEDQRLILQWLNSLALATSPTAELRAAHSPLWHGLIATADAVRAESRGQHDAAMFAWQNALYHLWNTREMPFYFLVYSYGLKHLVAAKQCEEPMRNDLRRRVLEYAGEAEIMH